MAKSKKDYVKVYVFPTSKTSHSNDWFISQLLVGGVAVNLEDENFIVSKEIFKRLRIEENGNFFYYLFNPTSLVSLFDKGDGKKVILEKIEKGKKYKGGMFFSSFIGTAISKDEYDKLPENSDESSSTHTHTHTHTRSDMATKLVLHLRPDMKASADPQEIKPGNWNELGEFTVTRILDDSRGIERRVFLQVAEKETKYGKIKQFVFEWNIVADKSVVEKISGGTKIKIKVFAREDLSNWLSENIIKVGGDGIVSFASATIKSLELTLVSVKKLGMI